MRSFFKPKIVFNLFMSLILLSISSYTRASDFSLPFVNASELGNLYSGAAASANDASTSYTNPAGLTKLTRPQLVAAAIGVKGNVFFHGTATTATFNQSGTANGVMGGFLPLLYYSHPLSKNIVMGFGMNAPFGLGTNYAKDSLVRYIATRSQIIDIDFGPSIGARINDHWSLGLGLDIQQLNLTLKNMIGPPISTPDAESHNYLKGWGYGMHGGVLYEFTPASRIGLTYHSQTMFHPSGYSEIFSSTSGNFRVTQRANTALPAMAQLSFYHDLGERWTTMATLSYTHWSTLNQITLQNSVFPGGSVSSVTIPFQYHNTLDYSVGFNFKASEKWLLRIGTQYLNTPSNNRDRSVVDPLGNAILVGVGAHYQQNLQVGYDIGYAHNFCQNTVIHTVTPIASTIGHAGLSPNILGAQLTWTI